VSRLRQPYFALMGMTLCLLPILGGCVNQHQEVQTYRDVVDAGLPKPQSYQTGQPLTLQRAMALANQDNEQIALSGENYLQALINKNLALASFLPTVGLQPDYTIEQAPRNGTASGGPQTPAQQQIAASSGGYVVRGSTFQRTEVPVIGTMSVNPAQDSANVKTAEEQIIQQRQLLLDAQQTVLLNVAQSYYQVLGSEDQVRVLQASLDTDEARLADAQARFQNHLALALEVSQTLSEVAATRASLVQAQSDVRSGRRVLAFLIGVPTVDGPLSDDVIVPDTLLDVTNYQQLAASQRQDLLAAQTAVAAAKAAVDAAVGQYYPSISLNVSGFLYREYFSDASKWDAILIANLPIFSAGIIEADVRAAWSHLRQAALTESLLRRQIDQDVQTAYDNLTTSEKTLIDLKLEVAAAADARRQSGDLLKNGLAIPLDVLVAQETLLNAELVYTSENFDRTVFYLDLLRTAGQLNVKTANQWPTSRPTTLQ
jgi:outer membrane protein TolC